MYDFGSFSSAYFGPSDSSLICSFVNFVCVKLIILGWKLTVFCVFCLLVEFISPSSLRLSFWYWVSICLCSCSSVTCCICCHIPPYCCAFCRFVLYSCWFRCCFFLYKNLISWLIRNHMAWAVVFLSCCLCPLVLMEIYFGCSCFSLQILWNIHYRHAATLPTISGFNN